MDEKQSLEELISRGEGQSLEFKAAIPTPRHLARTIAAFANSGGGTILLGVREDGSVPGVSFYFAEKALESALQLLKPPPEALLTQLSGVRANAVARIDVAAEPAGPVAVPDGLFYRSGTSIEPLPAGKIREKALSK